MNYPESSQPQNSGIPKSDSRDAGSLNADSLSNDEAEFEDAMLDVLLAELLAGQTPPDQSRLIIRRLDDPVKPASGSRSTSVNKPVRPGMSPGNLALLTAAVVLLCVGVGVGYRNELGFVAKPGLAKTTDTDPATTAPRVSGGMPKNAPETLSPVPTVPAETAAARSIELASGSSNDDLPSRNPLELFNEPSPTKSSPANDVVPPARPLTLVSTSMTSHLQRYWNRLGVQPTDMLSADRIALRLSDKLRLTVPSNAVGDSQGMLTSLNQPANMEALSQQILATISSRRIESLTRPSDQLMLRQIATTLRSGSGFDKLLASWFVETPAKTTATTGNAEADQDDAEASLGALLQPLGFHEAIVTSAAVTLGADVRCQRCHDVPPGNPRDLSTQHDYWQLAANLSPWLNRNPNSPQGWFYDTLDGRRRLAQSNTNTNWPQALLGSRPLAEGLVAAMWKMVHGRPLESSPYDLAGSASDTDLRQLRNELADDLIASEFHLLRTISLMLTDSIVGRSTPAAMTPTGLLTASNDEWMQAVSTIESFAAAPPESLPSSRRERMLLVQRSDLPQTGSTDGSASVLAQPLSSSDDDAYSGSSSRKPTSPATVKPSPAMLAGLPLRATIVMPAWIVELPDFDSRLEHIAHLAGLGDVPREARDLAVQMQTAGVQEALILQRIWWIIRPQG